MRIWLEVKKYGSHGVRWNLAKTHGEQNSDQI